MAGNLVKWWKHKILGGYKQFSVQECTTDSEELMYHQVRASSSCSAPPDLLLVSDRENNIPLRSPVVNIIGNTTTTTSTNNTAPATTTTSPSSANACHITTTTSASNNNQKHNQKLHSHHQHHHHVTAPTTTTQQQQLSLAYNGTKDIGNVKSKSVIGNSNNSSGKLHQQQLSLQDCQQTVTAHDIEGQLENQTNNHHSSTRHAQHHHTQHNHHHHQQQQQQRPEEHIRLEEFTCDVSVEGGKSSQPLQFSFTFYDLDGHHGKITKDDIVGIVYTIYESIGKSVVVPHSGSKTINVRLTVSPEGKSKSNKTKKNANSSALVLDAQQKSAPLTTNAAAQAAARRLHRYRPRKLIKSDEEDDDSNSDKERDNSALNHNSSNLSHVLAHSKSSSATKNHKLSKLKAEHHCCAPTSNTTLPVNNVDLPNSPLDTIYDNLKAANNTTATTPEACRECLAAVDESRNLALSPTAVQYPAHKTSNTNEAYMKHVASTRIKMLRKSRKQKHQDCLETRQRSLSVGNETCWKNRHLQKQQNAQQQLLWQAEQQLNQSANVGAGSVIMDGVQLRNPLKNGALKSSTSAAQKRNSAECWKTALNRNDLISIIRESMEKNRLCFQLNGKPQANVSPIRHSQTPTQQQQPIPPHHQQHLLPNQHNNSSSISNNKHSQHQTSTTPTTSTQRQRSNTVSKIPTLIANHSSTHSAQHYHANNSSNSSAQHHHHRSSSCANTINNNTNSNQQHLQQHDLSLHDTPNITNSSNSNNVYHQHQHLPQPHIPIYHQQMAINPAIIAAHNNLLHSGSNSTSAASSGGHHSKMNLCGYDSFLHATICGGGLSHSPPAHSNHTTSNAIASPLTTAVTSSGHQQIATVQPIMSSQSHAAAKHQLSLAVTPSNQIKTSKILRSGSYAAQTQQQHHPNTTQNSPQYHGYQRLPSSSKHNLAALHLVSPSMEKPPLDQLDKWRRDQVKNYDQLLYAKLSEKLQQTQLVASSSSHTRESHQRRKHRILKQRRANNLIQEANNVPTLLANKLCVREDSDYATLIPIEGDAVECENLLGQSSDEENLTPAESSSPLTSEEKPREQQLNSNSNSSSRHVAEGTLVDLDDVDVEEELEDETDLQTSLKLNQLPLNADSLLRVEEDEVHDLHLANGLDIDDVLADDLADDLADVVAGIAQTQSGRNSAASNEDVDSLNGVGATLANTTNSGANTSTTSSSLIHRYVHEHIHHHYHHFEEKEE